MFSANNLLLIFRGWSDSMFLVCFLLPFYLDNPIGNSGVASLYEAIKSRIVAKLSILTFINLTSSSLTKEGARIIHDMICESKGALTVAFESSISNSIPCR